MAFSAALSLSAPIGASRIPHTVSPSPGCVRAFRSDSLAASRILGDIDVKMFAPACPQRNQFPVRGDQHGRYSDQNDKTRQMPTPLPPSTASHWRLERVRLAATVPRCLSLSVLLVQRGLSLASRSAFADRATILFAGITVVVSQFLIYSK